jgi:hypothetical protein
MAAARRLLALRGLHPAGAGPALADYLRQAGLAQVEERRLLVGTGRQASRQQRLLVADFLAAHRNLQPILVQAGCCSETNDAALLAVEQVELPQTALILPCTFAWGQQG